MAALETLSRLCWLSAVFLLGCATAQTPEGRKELERLEIHAHHNMCMAWAQEASRLRGQDALAYFQCDANSDGECHAAGLEHLCDQWENGGD